MTSKFERDLLLPAYDIVEKARAYDKKAGTNFRLGFEQSYGDQIFAGLLIDWHDMKPVDPLVVPSMAMLIHSMLRWYDGGCPRFRLTHGLTTELALTDPTGVPMSEIRQPFPTYVIELPRPSGPLLWDSRSDGVREPTYLIVHSNRINETQVRLPERITGSSLVAYRDLPLRPTLGISIVDDLSYPAKLISHSDFVDGNTVDTRKLHRSPDVPFVASDYDDGCVAMAWRIAFNLPLYLRHRPSSSGSSGKTVNHDHGMRSTLYEVGADVPLNRDLRDAARAACSTDHDGTAWTLAKRFIVRGHWKMQPIGVGRSDRKLIFVEPYWKGPADAPLVARVHVDKGS